MSDTVVKVENVSKRYLLGERSPYKSIRESVMNTLKIPFHLARSVFGLEEPPSMQDFWALKDVSFELKRGEVLGLIGRNGSGKSTLLKILSRITEPTTGRIELNGRVGSLLEVGTGFHPELTGRENVFFNGSILGMSKAEISKKFDEIVAFSGVEKFLDTPVKHYSSGMYMRLAFSVAAHLEPEILLVDEVLAVGDAEFQKKCLGKMDDVAKQGRTVIFVSHNMESILKLTKSSIVIEDGSIIYYGSSQNAISQYLNTQNLESKCPSFQFEKKYIEFIEMISFSEICDSGDQLTFEFELLPVNPFDFNVEGWITDALGDNILFFSEGQINNVSYKIQDKLTRVVTKIQLPYLAEGKYFFSFALSEPNIMTYAGIGNPICFEVVKCDPCKNNFSMKANSPNRGKILIRAKTCLTQLT